jgi:hypothetical protein
MYGVDKKKHGKTPAACWAAGVSAKGYFGKKRGRKEDLRR